MGFRAKRKVFTLLFEGDDELDGLYVCVRSVSLGTLLKVSRQAETMRDKGDLAQVDELVELFVDRVESWNLENEEGEPTPVTAAGLLEHETDLVMALVLAWFDAMVSVPKNDPLDGNSTSGKPFPEESIPMAEWSADLLS